MRDPYVKMIDDTLYCNPPMGTVGQRRDESGDNPYLSAPDFSFALESEPVCRAVGKIMVAYNLFGFAELWFSDYRTDSWQELNFHKTEVVGRCSSVGDGTILGTTMFYRFLDDMNTALGLEPRYDRREEMEPVLREGVEDVGTTPTGNVESDPAKAIVPVGKAKYEGEEGSELWKYLVIGLGVVGIGVMVTD